MSEGPVESTVQEHGTLVVTEVSVHRVPDGVRVYDYAMLDNPGREMVLEHGLDPADYIESSMTLQRKSVPITRIRRVNEVRRPGENPRRVVEVWGLGISDEASEALSMGFECVKGLEQSLEFANKANEALRSHNKVLAQTVDRLENANLWTRLKWVLTGVKL